MDVRFWRPRRRSRVESRWWLVVGAVIGAGAMYLMDPVAGGRRRALARDKITGWARKTGEAVDDRSRHLRNRARGLVVQLRSRFGASDDDEAQAAGGVSPPPESRSF
jgi:hypothetical protein